MRGLFWFREDLRLHDNPVLLRLAEQCDELILLYCFDDRQLAPGRFLAKGIGAPRMTFLKESLEDLAQAIAHRNQRLIFRRGDPVEVVSQLLRRHSVDCLGVTTLPGPLERKAVEAIERRFPWLEVIKDWGHTLFSPEQLPVSIAELPDNFNSFTALVQHRKPLLPEPTPDHLPPPPVIAKTEESDPFPTIENPYRHEWVPPDWFGFYGGEQAAFRQLNYYLWDRHLIRQYESTHNGFIGWNYSSKFGPWLALGCLSVRQVWYAVRSYEHLAGECESTQRLLRELLWREYFQWLMKKYGEQVFQPGGIHGEPAYQPFYPEEFAAWTQGKTGIPIIDACMRELKTTGWLSRRGRRMVAHFLANELDIDWRYGAAWFQQQLIDADLAVNWGNWSHVIRAQSGRSQLDNVLKQAYEYDPQAEYVSLWLPELKELPESQRHTPFWSRKPADFRFPIVDVAPWRAAL